MNARRLFLSLGVMALLGFGAFSVVGTGAVTAQQTGGQSGEQTSAQSTSPDGGLLEYEQNTVSVVEEYGPSVVSVNVTARGQQVTNPSLPENLPDDFLEQLPPQFREFFDQLPGQPGQGQQPQQPQPVEGAGSGFVIDEQGRIITNYHVVRAALQDGSVNLTEGSEVTVTFPSNDEAYPVRVVGANALYDLALLELQNPDELPESVTSVPPIPFANSDELSIGQKSIAIGNPFGFNSSVTIGIVSGVGRSLPGVGEADIPLIQTDAAINPGNSGGPLLNSRGELIGVNTAIIPGQGGGLGQRGNIGIGFAVPSNLLQSSLAQLESGGVTDLSTRARLGASIASVDVYPDSVRQELNLPEEGVALLEVAPGSAAERAGLQGGQFEVTVDGQPIPAGGDVILSVDGQEVSSSGELQRLIFAQEEGDTVELRIWRNGEEMTVPVTLSVVPQERQAQAPQEDTGGAAEQPSGPRLGVGIFDVQNYPEGVRSSLGLPDQGVAVTAVQPGSPAEQAGLQAGEFTVDIDGEAVPVGGDIILAVNGQEVTTPQELQQVISSQSAGDTVDLRILRDGEEQTVQATLAAPEGQGGNN